MGRDWRQWVGQVVNGTFPLRQYVGGSDHSAVFLTERRGRDPQRAAIKLIAVDPAYTAFQLANWEFAAKLSHPHLLRLFETGSCQLDDVVLLYVVMEYADENLAQILPQRPLSADEARDLLEPALDALAYIHGKSMVHGRLKPSNIMATQDQLKLSSDTLVRVDEQTPAANAFVSYRSAYNAPEIASGRISPAADSWSLGVTLMEALTQRLPGVDGTAEPVLETVPVPFMGIAHCCLRRDPQKRCSAADIAGRLRSNSYSPIPKAMSKPQSASTVRIPASSAKWRYILPVAALALIGTAVLIGPRLFNQNSGEETTAQVSSGNSADSDSAPSLSSQKTGETPKGETAKTEQVPSATRTKPSGRRTGSKNQNLPPSTQTVDSASVAAPVADAPSSSTRSAVVQQVDPSVSRSARETIHGTIKVRVKVAVDASGNVQAASFVTPGPSKYFARQAMDAAQQWKFSPAPGQNARSWIVRFGFRRSGTEAALEPAKP